MHCQNPALKQRHTCDKSILAPELPTVSKRKSGSGADDCMQCQIPALKRRHTCAQFDSQTKALLTERERPKVKWKAKWEDTAVEEEPESGRRASRRSNKVKEDREAP